jgi:hypothetical protein
VAYSLALFVHVCGALLLFMAIALEVVGALGFRSARTVDQVRLYGRIIKSAAVMFPIATVALITAGAYMAVTQWSFSTPFVAVGLLTLVAVAAQASLIQGRRWQAVMKSAEDADDGPIPAGLQTLMSDQLARASTGAMAMAGVGVVAIMTLKPGWVGCIAIVAVSWIAGFVGARMLTA